MEVSIEENLDTTDKRELGEIPNVLGTARRLPESHITMSFMFDWYGHFQALTQFFR
jgi:hypothetical protein